MKKAKDQPGSEPAELASLVGERIRKIRKEEGLSLELFALGKLVRADTELLRQNLPVPLCLGEQNKEIRVFKDVLDLRAGKEVFHILR